MFEGMRGLGPPYGVRQPDQEAPSPLGRQMDDENEGKGDYAASADPGEDSAQDKDGKRAGPRRHDGAGGEEQCAKDGHDGRGHHVRASTGGHRGFADETAERFLCTCIAPQEARQQQYPIRTEQKPLLRE